MKNTWKIIGITLMVLSLVVLFSCEEEGMSKADRADAFIDDLNTDSRSNIGDHFTGVLSAVDASTFSTGVFSPDNQPFSYSYSTSGDTVTGTLTYYPADIMTTVSLDLSMDSSPLGGLTGGEDWKIDGITLNDVSFP